jgi:plastocyanin domain-containing protein
MKYFIIVLVVAIIGVGGIFVISNKDSKTSTSFNAQEGNNVQVIDGKQIIYIEAKGGYSPKKTIAKADMPTVLEIKTNGTIDCSTSLIIQDIGYRGSLKPTGVEKIDIKPQSKGTILKGICSMGMYSFQIKFE